MFAFATVVGGLFWFALGACVGSFLNVLVYRTERGENWVSGRSHCDECGQKISWFDNIPLLSYALLRGRCRGCHQTISIAHPVVEALFGFLFMWWWLLGSFFFKLTEEPFTLIQPLFWLIVGAILIFILVEDLLSMYIPLWSVYALTLLALFYRVSLVVFGIMRVEDFLSVLIATLCGAAFFYALHAGTRGKGMGLGDVYLAVPIILLVGWPRMLVWLFLSFCIGALVGLIMLALKKAQFGKRLPFGPFMVIATFLTLMMGDALFAWYLSFL